MYGKGKLDKTTIELVKLRDLKTWKCNEAGEIVADAAEFKIVFCNIEIEGREVQQWQQPLLEAIGESTFGLIYCIDDNVMKFLIKAKSEIGCFDKIEIGPSVQLGPNEQSSNKVEALFVDKLNKNEGVEFQGVFSEEGGRFYHEQNRNVIMKIEKEEIGELEEGYFWADYQTVNILIQFNNCLNIQLRNLFSIIDL